MGGHLHLNHFTTSSERGEDPCAPGVLLPGKARLRGPSEGRKSNVTHPWRQSKACAVCSQHFGRRDESL